MDDFKELENFDVDEDEVQLEDLDVPDKGPRAFFYRLGEKLHTAHYFRPRLIAPTCTIIMLLILFLPGSVLPSPTANTPHTTATTSQENTACHDITVNSKDSNWHIPPSIPTPPDSVTLHLCDFGNTHIIIVLPTPVPVRSNSK